jgi:integrase
VPKIDETWEGGYVRVDAKGRGIYIIRRSIGGKRYEVSTRCTTRYGARRQLERFEADPESYQALPESALRQKLTLTIELIAEFMAWSADKGNGKEWRYQQTAHLHFWMNALNGVDLRKADLDQDILPALKGASSRAHRIAVLKTFYGWLVHDKRVLDVDEDPTYAALSVPQSIPEQLSIDKVISKEHIQKIRDVLEPHWRDVVDIQSGTGWHVSEVIRFAKYGRINPYPGTDPTAAGVLVCPTTKSGEPLNTAVSQAVLEAGKRLLARGTMTYKNYAAAIKVACSRVGLADITPGCFRHSVATWAINQGEDPAKVAAFLNHKDQRTTRRFYATFATPAKVKTIL